MNFNACESEVQYGLQDVSLWNFILNKELVSPSTLIQSTRPMQSTYECPFQLDDRETRQRLWDFFFPDKPFQEREEGAVQRYFGIFDKRVKKDHPKDAFDRILSET